MVKSYHVTDMGLAYWSYYILRMGHMQKPLSIIFMQQFPEWLKLTLQCSLYPQKKILLKKWLTTRSNYQHIMGNRTYLPCANHQYHPFHFWGGICYYWPLYQLHGQISLQLIARTLLQSCIVCGKQHFTLLESQIIIKSKIPKSHICISKRLNAVIDTCQPMIWRFSFSHLRKIL